MNNFLITYDTSQLYNFFSDTGEACKVSVFIKKGEEVFSQIFSPIAFEAEPEQDEYYVRDMLDASLKTKKFILDGFEEASKTFELPTNEWVAFYDETSFALRESGNLDYTFNITDGQVSINVVGPVEEQIIVQLKYYCGFSLIEGETYKVEIENTSYEFEAKTRDEKLYLGDYSVFFGEEPEEPIEPDKETITIDSKMYTEVNSYVTYSEDDETKYKVTFNKSSDDPIEYIVTSAQTTIQQEGQELLVTYVGNLNIYNEGAPSTEEPFFICTAQSEDEEGQTVYTSYLYVREAGTYKLKVESYKINEIPALKGAALVSFANVSGSEIDDNYGIGINSSDQGLTLPERAISLFETELDNSSSDNKIKFNYRGILGTLPLPNSIGLNESSIYSNNMVGTQGIFTDNMYIGDKNQYVAFYTDSETKEKQLSIKANNITIKGGQSIFNIGDSIDTLNTVVNPTGWIADHGEYAKTEDIEIVDGKLYYRRATNLIEYPFHHTTRTENGITFTDNGDGTITANGTATANTGFGFRVRNTEHLRLQDIDYTFTGCPEGGADDTYYVLLDYGTGTEYGRDYGSGVTFTGVPNQDTGIWIQIREGAEISNLTFEARLKNASEAEYIPVTPISNPKDEGLYELASVDRGVSNYIATHLALTKEGLYVQTDKDGIYKVLLKSNGLFILKNDTPISVFSENPQIGTSERQHLNLSPNVLRFMYQGKVYAKFGINNAEDGISYNSWTRVNAYGPYTVHQLQVHTLKSAYYIDNQEEIPLEKIEIINTISPYGFTVNLLVSEQDFRPYKIIYDAIGPADYYDLGLNSRQSNSKFGLHSICIGYNNIASGENSIAIGNNNKVQGRGITFGNSLITNTPFSIALGTYNEPKGSTDGTYYYNSPLLSVGLGTDDNNRRNSFELNYNGCSTVYIYDGSGTRSAYKIKNISHDNPGGFLRIEDEALSRTADFGLNNSGGVGIWVDDDMMIYQAGSNDGVYVKDGNTRIDKSMQPYFSWTSTVGTLSSCNIEQYGKVVHLSIQIQNKEAVAAGSNIFRGTFSPASIRPKRHVTSGSYYGKYAFTAVFNSAGTLTVRNANHEAFNTITYGTSNSVTMSFTYIVD